MLAPFYKPSDIDAAYLDPLRSVLLIDDQFPRYKQLLTNDPPDRGLFDTETVGMLMKQFRDRGLMCDVENRASDLTDERIRHLGKSDLVVLDYHLERHNVDSPEQALRILRHLADSHHANLVVVYTNATNLDNVRREISAHLRGIDTLPESLEEFRDVLNTWDPVPDSVVIDLFLSGNDAWKGKVNGLRSELKSLGVPAAACNDAIKAAIESYLQREYRCPKDRLLCEIQASQAGGAHRWVHCQNVFVAIATKKDQTSPLDELRQCIIDWNPPPLQILLAQARSHLEQGGFQYEQDVLRDFQLHVGWMYHALYGDEVAPEKRVEQLVNRLFSGLQKQLAEGVLSAANALISRVNSIPLDLDGKDDVQKQQARLVRAGEFAGKTGEINAPDIIHALNSYFCSEPYSGAHLRPGTVFCSTRDGAPKEWFVCVAPACEMVPREDADKKSWKNDLSPLFPVDVLRLEALTGLSGPLQRARNCRHLFIADWPKRVALQVADDTTRQSRKETLFVVNRGTTTNRAFQAYRIGSPFRIYEGGHHEPQIETLQCIAVAQLRPSYADRILQEVGFQTSRVGVDFANLAVKTA